MKKLANALIITLLLSFLLGEVRAGSLMDNPVLPKKEEKSEKKRRDEFKIFGGVSFNNLSVSSDVYSSVVAPGWMLGGSYKRGKFFYWEAGLTYNNAVFNLTRSDLPADSSNLLDGVFGVNNIDIPITVGLNLLWFTSRIVGLRVFVSAIPEFSLGVGDNDLGITIDNLNSFNFVGLGGIGLDVTFIYLEAGASYGFGNLFINDVQSNPFQIFLKLGFRF